MKNKPLCVLVDDNKNSLNALVYDIEEIGLLEVEKTFTDPDKFLSQLDQLKSEIVFLDMDMHINGVEVARRLQGKRIIFVSAHKEEAYKAYDVAAVDFVPKPVLTSRLKSAIEKVLPLISPKVLVLKTDSANKHEILINTILFVEPHPDEKRDKNIHLNDGEVIRAKNYDLKDLRAQLPSNKFLMLNSSQLVNLDCVTKLIDRDTVGVRIGRVDKECTLGESHKSAFFAAKPHLKA